MEPRVSRKVSKRKKRTPLGSFRAKMAVDPNLFPKHHLRWINDELNRISYALNAGYEFVSSDELANTDVGDRDVLPNNTDSGTRVSQVVGTKEDSAPLTAFLMKIPLEFYEEDQIEKQRIISESETAMFRGQHDDTEEGDTRYVPKEGMSIRRGS